MELAVIARYLLLPLRTAPLLLILVLDLMLSLALAAGLFGVPLLIIVVSWFFKYSFALLDAIIEGRQDPPVLSMEMVNPVEQRPLGMLAALGAFYWFTLWVESKFGFAAASSLRVIGLLLVPAMVASMSISGRFLGAFNLADVFGVIARAPAAYFALVVVIGLMWFVPYTFIRYGFEWLVPGAFAQESASIPTIALHLLAMYLWLAMCACIGGMVYEYRERLGYEPNESPERTEEKRNRELDQERDKVMDGIFAQCRGNALTNAGVSVRKIIDGSSTPLAEFRWLYIRAAQWPDPRLANYLVQYCLPMFLQSRANGEALDLVRSRLRVDRDFRPLIAGEALKLAALARDAGDRPTARLLLENFEQRFPNDPANVLAAQLRSELQR